MKDLVKLDTPELNSVETSKAEQIRATFEPMVKMLDNLEERYLSVEFDSQIETTPQVMQEARLLRLEMKNIRTSAEKLRVKSKEEYLRAGKAIDGVSNILKWAIVEKEDRLKEIENHAKLIEEAKIKQLKEDRELILSEFLSDEETLSLDLGGMDEEVWNIFLAKKKKDCFDRAEAFKKAEEERLIAIAEAEKEREEMLKENKRLKEAQEKLTKEREAQDKIIAAEKEAQDKIIAEKEAVEKALIAEKEAVEKALNKARQDEENRLAKEKAIEAKALEAALFAGDEDKTKHLIHDLENLINKYIFDSYITQAKYVTIQDYLQKSVDILKS